MKDEFYESLDKAYGKCPKQAVKIVINNAKAQIRKEDFFRPVIGTDSLHSIADDHGLRLVTFAAAGGIYFACKDIRGLSAEYPSWISRPFEASISTRNIISLELKFRRGIPELTDRCPIHEAVTTKAWEVNGQVWSTTKTKRLIR